MLDIINVNVGGTVYSSTRATLTRDRCSKLARIVDGCCPTPRDADGNVFIDRNGRFFEQILNYLRDGWTLLPGLASERRELLHEVMYYQLCDMEAWMRSQEALGDKADAIPSRDEATILASRPGSPHKSPSPAPAPATPPRIAARHSHVSPALKRAATGSLNDFISKSSHCCDDCRHACSPSPCVPSPVNDALRWTAKYLRTNPKMREVVDTLLELAYMPPRNAISTGRVCISIVSCPKEESFLSNRYLVIKVHGCLGWVFEFTVRPTCDYCLYQKYNISEYVQDNWFVLSAILKDQYGIVMEEDCCQRHTSILARRYNMHIVLCKPCC